MVATKNADGSFTLTITGEEAETLCSDFREIDRHFDLTTFFGGEDVSFERLVDSLQNPTPGAD